jgi:hypothetical protein
MARTGRDLLCGEGRKAMLATVRDGEAPRVHPISVGIVADELCAFILASAKLDDLVSDGRYALHAQLDPQEPNEFLVRGRAREMTDADFRAAAISGWPFSPDDSYRLFAFDIESALAGRRASADDWPPRYERWSGA